VAPSLQLATLTDEIPNCDIKSLTVYEVAYVDAQGRVMVGKELGVIQWDQERGPVVDLAVLVEIEANQPKSQVELNLAIMAGEGQYDVAGASMAFQLTRKRALAVFEFVNLDLGPEFWNGATRVSQLLFRIRPGRLATPFDECLSVFPGRQSLRGDGVEKAATVLMTGQNMQVVFCRQENPLARYRRSGV